MKNILCYGDSNTFGYDPVTTSRFDYEKRWTTLLNDMVKERGFRVIEEGLNGRTTSLDDDRPDILPNRVGRSGLEYLPVILESHYPVDILVIMLGTNDCKKRYMSTGEKIAEGMEKCIEEVRKLPYPVQILLVSPSPLSTDCLKPLGDIEFGKSSYLLSMELSPLYRKIAEKYNCMFLDAFSCTELSTLDGIHFTEKGHRMFAHAVYNALSKIL